MFDTMSLFIVHVNVHVKPETAGAFIAATSDNARHSRLEPGVVRFDLLQISGEPERFLLVEIYRDAAAAAAHKETEHYARWRDAVVDLMAEPRSSVKLTNLDPDDTDF
jgi:quinol monooxygenase YgiN